MTWTRDAIEATLRSAAAVPCPVCDEERMHRPCICVLACGAPGCDGTDETVRVISGPLDDEDRWLLRHGDRDEGDGHD